MRTNVSIYFKEKNLGMEKKKWLIASKNFKLWFLNFFHSIDKYLFKINNNNDLKANLEPSQAHFLKNNGI